MSVVVADVVNMGKHGVYSACYLNAVLVLGEGASCCKQIVVMVSVGRHTGNVVIVVGYLGGTHH
ncbi:hypothetical protein CsSME_00015744 [Camellia sinensis var. sinensis]